MTTKIEKRECEDCETGNHTNYACVNKPGTVPAFAPLTEGQRKRAAAPTESLGAFYECSALTRHGLDYYEGDDGKPVGPFGSVVQAYDAWREEHGFSLETERRVDEINADRRAEAEYQVRAATVGFDDE